MIRGGYFRPRAKFLPADDEQLRHLVEALGQTDWSAIADRMPGKNARQCKERWVNYLAPSLSTAAWTLEEDFLLIRKYAELGAKWVQIAAFFPNRTDSMIKNRFNKLQRRDQKHRELLLRGEFAFMLPLLQTALAVGMAPVKPAVPPSAPVPAPTAVAAAVAAATPVIEEDEVEFWGEPFAFSEDLFAF
jgi:hypothetical protein